MDSAFIATIYTFFLYSSFIFIIPILTEIAICSKYSINRKFFSILAIASCCFLAAFRGKTGTDTLMYKNAYEIMATGGQYSNRWVDFEIGYVWLNRLLGKFGFPYEFLLFVMQLLAIVFVFMAIRELKDKINVRLAMFIYMSSYYFISFNMLRQSVAIAICMFAFSLLNKKRLYWYIFLVVLASLFHTSALICLGVLPIKFVLENKNMKIIQLLLVIIVLYLVFHRQILANIVGTVLNNGYYAGYFSRNADSSGTILGGLIQNMPYVFFLVGGYYIISQDRQFSVYYWLVILGICLSLLGKFTATQVHRISYYFTYLSTFVYARICRNELHLFGYRISGQLATCMLEAVLLIFYFYNFFYKGSSEVVPYLGFWNGY